jgi:hypothetical protein
MEMSPVVSAEQGADFMTTAFMDSRKLTIAHERECQDSNEKTSYYVLSK